MTQPTEITIATAPDGKAKSVPDSLCDAISSAALKSEIAKVDRQLKIYRDMGMPEEAPPVQKMNEKKASYESMAPSKIDFQEAARFVSPGQLVQILKDHGIWSTPANVKAVVSELPRCSREVEVPLAIEAIKQKWQSERPAVCAVTDDRLGELDAPSAQALKQLQACAAR